MKILQLLVVGVTDGSYCKSQNTNSESENLNVAVVLREEYP